MSKQKPSRQLSSNSLEKSRKKFKIEAELMDTTTASSVEGELMTPARYTELPMAPASLSLGASTSLSSNSIAHRSINDDTPEFTERAPHPCTRSEAILKAVPSSSSSKQTVMISEDPSHHNEDCTYYQWDVVYRQNLLTDAEMAATLTKHIVKKGGRGRGRKKNQRKKGAQNADIVNRVDNLLSSGMIRDYLDGSREYYNSHKDQMKEKCWCPTARQILKLCQAKEPPPPSKMESPPSPKVKLTRSVYNLFQETGLEFSEDEIDSIDEDEEVSTEEKKSSESSTRMECMDTGQFVLRDSTMDTSSSEQRTTNK